MSGRWQRGVETALGFARDVWLIVGLTLALFLCIELSYRAQGALKRQWSSMRRPGAESGSPWMQELIGEYKAATEQQRWHPYVYFRTQRFSGKYVNVDEFGVRHTIQAERPNATDIFMLGGSTLFGTFQRDEGTIPSVLARTLASCGAPPVRLRNLGQSGRVFAQEVLDLIERLRDGAAPRVVVFYDGINDVAAFVQNRHAGWPQNEHNRSRDFKLGQTVFWWETDLRSDAAAGAYLAVAGLTRSQFLQRIRPFSIPAPVPTAARSQGTDAEAIATSYGVTIRLVEALSREFSFTPLYVWQPTIHSTRKRLSEGETDIVNALHNSEFGRSLMRLHREVVPPVDTAARRVAGDRFVNLSTLFDDVREPIFGDDIGHTYERANEILARALAPHVIDALDPQHAGGVRQSHPSATCR